MAIMGMIKEYRVSLNFVPANSASANIGVKFGG